jgi:hypothetical protein
MRAQPRECRRTSGVNSGHRQVLRALSPSNFANGALGTQRRQDNAGIKLSTIAAGWRSSVRRSISPMMRQAGQTKVSHGRPAMIAALIVK